MFKLKIKSGEKKIVYGDYSLSIRYLIDDTKLKENLNNFELITNTKLSRLQRKNFLLKYINEVRVSRPQGKPDELIIVKINIDESFSTDFFRNHLAGLIQSLENLEVNSLHIFIPKYSQFKDYFKDEQYYYQTFTEGLFLGNYQFDVYRSDKKKVRPLQVTLYSENDKLLKNSIELGIKLMHAVYFAKDLQNEPGGVLTPDELAKRIKNRMLNKGIKVKVFNEKDIRREKMGGLWAVGKGSSNPSRFIVIEYNGASKYYKKKGKPKFVALVGKGVTFDSGGISIKPYQGMWEMKADMSGAAVVAAVILAASSVKAPINILGIIPAAENMLSGSSMRPGDIVKTLSGKTIEVDNTDAEGRMILADALSYASKYKPEEIIDLATLTGACVVALGEFVAGLFSTNDSLKEKLFEAGIKTHERVWPMPMWADYKSLNKSNIADVKNNGGRWAGAISAAKFLETFVDKKIPWAHIDIAGPAMSNDNNNYTKKYMTGYGVRLIFEYLYKFR